MPKDITSIIAKKLRTTDQTAADLAVGLTDALGYHKQVGEMYCGNLSLTEYREEITTALHALERTERRLESIGIQHCQTLDTLYRDANEGDTTLMNLPRTIGPNGENAAIYILAQRLRKTLELALKNISTPGKGGMNRERKKYIAGIEMLARYFSEAFPKNKLSASQTGKFYKYVELWFMHSLEQDDPGDLRPHIRNTLKFGVRLTHKIDVS